MMYFLKCMLRRLSDLLVLEEQDCLEMGGYKYKYFVCFVSLLCDPEKSEI